MSMVEQIATVNADFKRCFEDIYEYLLNRIKEGLK